MHTSYFLRAAGALLLVAIVATSCKKDNEDPNPQDPLCEVRDTLSAPTGFTLEKLGTIPTEYAGGMALEMIDQNVGYAVDGVFPGNQVGVFKTTDGARNWTRLNTGSAYNPISMHFKNASTGVVSVHDLTGCPNRCEDRCVLLRTTDGGETWESITVSNLKGRMHHLQSDASGRLFGFVNLSGSNGVVVYSDDDAATWDTLYASPDIEFISIRFSFSVAGDRLYVATKNGVLHVIDRDGVLLETIETGQSPINTLHVFDENTLLVSSYSRVTRTFNRGATWEVFYEGINATIDFPSADIGLMVRNNSFCPTDIVQSNDVLAYTTDGGLTWKESDERTNLAIGFRAMYRLAPDDYLLLIDGAVYRLKAQ
jgi:hypothetical protein